MKAEQLTPVVAEHAEGPVYSPRWEGVRWVDIPRGDIFELAPGGGVSRVHIDKRVCLIRPRSDAGMVIATEHEILLTDSDDLTALTHPLATILSNPEARLNEGTCGPDGALYIGSMAYDLAPERAELWRVDSSGNVKPLLDRLTISNGIDWSPDHQHVYLADTPTDQIDVFDWDESDGLQNRRPFAPVAFPDGLCVDSEGGVWVARYGSGDVIRLEDKGVISEVISVGTPDVTAVTFAGKDLNELIITTSNQNQRNDGSAGALFRAFPQVTGVPVRVFAGSLTNQEGG